MKNGFVYTDILKNPLNSTVSPIGRVSWCNLFPGLLVHWYDYIKETKWLSQCEIEIFTLFLIFFFHNHKCAMNSFRYNGIKYISWIILELYYNKGLVYTTLCLEQTCSYMTNSSRNRHRLSHTIQHFQLLVLYPKNS